MSGILIGFYVGYLVEPNYIGFNVKGKWGKQLFKILIGLGIFLILESVLKGIFPKTLICDLLIYLLLGLWLTIGAPFIFNKIS